ncbi:MAG: sensor histidine kinase [Devosia sp.]
MLRDIASGTTAAATRFADLFIPTSLRHVRSSRELARVFVLSHVMGAVACLALLIYLAPVTPLYDLGFLVVGAMMFAFLGLVVALRQTGNMPLVTLTSFQSMTLTSLVGTFEYGGFGSPFLPWLMVSLMSGLFYQPRRTGLVVGLFLADVAVFFAFLLLTAHPQVSPRVNLTLLSWISIAVALSYMALMALYYARIVASRAELQAEAERYRAVAAELEQASAAAESLNRSRSLFFSKMSHELRTPLNAIIGYSEILIEDFDDQPEGDRRHRADLQRINSTGRHLLSLVSDVLDVDTMENGDAALELKAMTLGELCDDVVAASAPLLEMNGNRLVIDCPFRTDSISTDPRKLRQMLINLMSNAAKFTRNGTVTLELWIERAEADDRLHAAVLDTGIGIAPDALPKLFETYVQADRTIQGRFGGTGIGLALTRKFAGLLGGTISVDSHPGKGSCFTIDIPAIAKAPEPTEPVAPALSIEARH